ncbi:pimeloyl-ACP methyl ester carboxylesterase [Arthrobacter pascens]|uniref:hypothetical protein n=1 Tax=Arthrobacter pascens TaxID=1677 RepID=UPI00278FCE35|nr:hypothetical protein [Arthrobacter pascens]MDQ0679370.1 pimeloyl-ACP methyl ester carboxylesterase [Arthrobacter pascens]
MSRSDGIRTTMPANPPADRTREVKEPALMSTPHRGRTQGFALVDAALVVPAGVGREGPAVAAPLAEQAPCTELATAADEPVLDVPPGVVDERGDMVSQLAGVMVDAERLREIDVPVLFPYGEQGARVQLVYGEQGARVQLVYGEQGARVQLGGVHKTLLVGAPPTTLVEVPDAGHYFDPARQHEAALDGLASRLDKERL